MIAVQVEMRAFQWDPCATCRGTGRQPSSVVPRPACVTCDGSGRIAHDPPRERLVEIPDDEWNSATSDKARLGLVFQYGQNDFQPRAGCYSMSVGDVARLPDGRRFMCDPIGWRQL